MPPEPPPTIAEILAQPAPVKPRRTRRRESAKNLGVYDADRDTLDQYLAVELTPEDLDLNNGREILFEPSGQIAALRKAITDAPKSTRWRLRARVGERASWYQEPEGPHCITGGSAAAKH